MYEEHEEYDELEESQHQRNGSLGICEHPSVGA